MNESQKRIEEYKGLLPSLKEKVVAVSLLLAMSATMLTTVSFAWLTLSQSPEVSNVNTSIASNGNLEIALVGKNGDNPAASTAEDGNLALFDRNITWGNLVNLSDPAYGLDNLVLRPALLNESELLTNPLYGAVYSDDGRMITINSDFGYTTWNLPDGDKPGYFGLSKDYGVRAISSITTEAVGAAQTYNNMVKKADAANGMAKSTYMGIANEGTWMKSLASMMGHYMTARMNSGDASLGNPTVSRGDITNMIAMYETFLTAFDKEAEALAELANIQLFLEKGEGNYVAYDKEKIYASNNTSLSADGVVLTDIATFNKDHTTIENDLEKLKAIDLNSTITWTGSGMNAIVNNLVNVGLCELGGTRINDIIAGGVSAAMGYIGGTHEATITNGILYNFERRTGAEIEVNNLSISVTVKWSGMTLPGSVTANILTNANELPALFPADQAYTESLNTGKYQGGEEVAEDTYGLAIDLWVRTNAAGSYLTLEGNILTEEETVRATAKDKNGKTVELWTHTVSGTSEDGEAFSYSVDLYQVITTNENNEEVVTWYNATTHGVYTIEEGASAPKEKYTVVQNIIGYEGENRVWEDAQNLGLTVNSTTQGSGSCYVYYADTPDDQARSLKLLESMNIVFVDGNGKKLATAFMDTEHFYAQNGKVIVPMVLSSASEVVGTDSNGNDIYAITALEQNVATRITAIVYLDGNKLTNKDVLSSADIQGQLNIQFGSSEVLNPIKNEELMAKELTVSAAIDKNSFDYDTADEMITNVSVTVEGDTPKEVKAFFLRTINSTQGSREAEMVFTYDEGSQTWKSSYEFTSPGVYVLRSVQLDGIDYELPADNRPTVTIEGFSVNSLGWDFAGQSATVMTASKSYSLGFTLEFRTDDVQKMPKTVVGRFMRDDGSVVNVNFTYNPTNGRWAGDATFLSSGEYSLQYLVLDGEYQEIDQGLQKFVTVYLGMKVAVYTLSETTFDYKPDEMTDAQKNLAMQVVVMDDTGNRLEGLDNVRLYYSMRGASTRRMETDLEWDGVQGYYVGTLQTQWPGIFEFNSVMIESSTVTNATVSPVFTIRSPEPPKYAGYQVNSYQYAPDGGAWAEVTIEQSAAATAVIAEFTNNFGETVTAVGSPTIDTATPTTATWRFIIPNNLTNGTQDGNWQLVNVKLIDVYDGSGKLYDEADPMVFDLTSENITTKVVQTVKIDFADGQSKSFGKEGDTITGEFMQSHSITGLNVDITDFEGKPIQDLGNVQLKFEYNGGSDTHGGYTRDDLTKATTGATVIVNLAQQGETGHYTQVTTEAKNIVFAGSYTTTFGFTQGSTGYSYDSTKLSDIPVFEVWSKTPTVIIDSISPAGDVNTCTLSEGTGTCGADEYIDSTSTAVKTDDYNATVYISCVGGTFHNYTAPRVVIKLDGFGSAASAKLDFGSTTHVYGGTQDGGTRGCYEWTANGSVSRSIGYVQTVPASSDNKAPAGTIKASELTLKDSAGNTYKVALGNKTITINNPN